MAVNFVTDASFFVEATEDELEFPLEFPLEWDTETVVATATYLPPGDVSYLSSDDVGFIT